MLCYAEGMTSRALAPWFNSEPTSTPEHLPALLGYRMDLDPSAAWLSGPGMPLAGITYVYLSLIAKGLGRTVPTFSFYKRLKSNMAD